MKIGFKGHCACVYALACTCYFLDRWAVAVCLVVESRMEPEGLSRDNPIYLSDTSPISVDSSPVKLLSIEQRRRCRYRAYILYNGYK